MASGLILDYLGSGLASARPVAPDIYTGALALYYATDTDALSAWDGATWEDIGGGGGGSGTVTSVDVSVPTGLTAAGGPVTTSGTITISYAVGYQGYTGTEASKLAGIATGATVGATWGTNLSSIPSIISALAALSNAAGTLTNDGSGNLSWGAGGGGMTNPMTTAGDMIVGGSGGSPTRTGVGTDGYVWTVVAGVPTWAAAGGGGLTGFTASLETASPNNTVNASVLIASGGSTNQDAVVSPKGTGAFQLQVATGNATGGNKRGQGAVDLQLARSAATQVASGNGAFTAGERNTASAAVGIAIGYSNGASGGGYAVAIGVSNSVASSGGAGIGQGNIVFANNGYAYGLTNTVGAVGAVAVGSNCTADGLSSLATGLWSTTRGLAGLASYSSGRFAALGDAQRMDGLLRRGTTDATPAVLSSDGAAPSTTNQFTLPNDSAYVIKATVVVRQNTTGDTAAWDVTFCIKRGANAASTALVGTPSVTSIGADAGAATWTVAVTANTTRGAPDFTVTGEASHTLRWAVDVYSCLQVVG